MWDDLLASWAVVLCLLYVLRIFCVQGIKSKSAALYEKLGKPLHFSRYSWKFLYKVSTFPEFPQLAPRVRYAVRAGQAGFAIWAALSVWLFVIIFRAMFFNVPME
jgi:hypothetical protein